MPKSGLVNELVEHKSECNNDFDGGVCMVFIGWIKEKKVTMHNVEHQEIRKNEKKELENGKKTHLRQ